MAKSALLLLAILCLVAPQVAPGQAGQEAGYIIIKLFADAVLDYHEDPKFQTVYFTEKDVYITRSGRGFLLNDRGYPHPVYTAPTEVRIVDARSKADDHSIIFVLLSNGTIEVAKWANHSWTKMSTTVAPSFANSKKIIGDAVYLLSSGKVYASRDTAKTWTIDSTNIGQESVQDIAVDTSHYAWVVTQSRKAYTQHPDSNVWRQNSSFTTLGFPQKVFVDRRGRIFISTTSASRVWMSTDNGSSWANTSTGIDETIVSFGDDAFGNVYAVGSGSDAYRLSNATLPWVSIAESLNVHSYLPVTERFVNTIGGDSVLTASTRYGLFVSTDDGTSWSHALQGSQARANRFFAGLVRAGGYDFVTTNLGIYRGRAGDSTWIKVFPAQGFVSGINALTSDSAGILYGNLPFRTGETTSRFVIVRSSDFGITWVPDTAGQTKLGMTAGTQMFDHWVDRQGNQFLGGSTGFFAKRPGQAWKTDSAGLGLKPGEFVAGVTLNNRKGIITLSRRLGDWPTFTLGLYRRSVTDSVWQEVSTSGLSAAEGKVVSDNDGNVILRTLSPPYKLWRFDGTTWTEIPLPTGIGSSPFAQTLSVDRSGVLWGVFFGGGFNKGVFFTTNSGTSWTHVGLDKVGVNSLSAVGDTVYATTVIDGIRGFTTASRPTSVSYDGVSISSSFELNQNYPNPFNPETRIRYAMKERGRVKLAVFDLLGREVAVLVDEEMAAGVHEAFFNGRSSTQRLASGIYLYRLTTGTTVETRKMLFLK